MTGGRFRSYLVWLPRPAIPDRLKEGLRKGPSKYTDKPAPTSGVKGLTIPPECICKITALLDSERPREYVL